MQGYGHQKHGATVHPHNTCDICSGDIKSKSRTRQEVSKEIKKEADLSILMEEMDHLGILGDVRERLGADNEDDDSKDYKFKDMSAADIVAAWTAWQLGDEAWAYNIISMHKVLEESITGGN